MCLFVCIVAVPVACGVYSVVRRFVVYGWILLLLICFAVCGFVLRVGLGGCDCVSCGVCYFVLVCLFDLLALYCWVC